MEDFKHIGYTGKAHGTDGRIKISPLTDYFEDFTYLEVVFIQEGNNAIPYFIEQINLNSQPPIAVIEDINSREKATAIANKKLFARKRDLREREVVSRLTYDRYIGYQLQDENLGVIGEILGVEEFPQQEMAFVAYQDTEKLIPLNEALVQHIDDEKQVIIVNLPEGLLDI